MRQFQPSPPAFHDTPENKMKLRFAHLFAYTPLRIAAHVCTLRICAEFLLLASYHNMSSPSPKRRKSSRAAVLDEQRALKKPSLGSQANTRTRAFDLSDLPVEVLLRIVSTGTRLNAAEQVSRNWRDCI